MSEGRPEADLLYLPNGRLLAPATLGYRHLAADVIYLWAIQYYGHYEIQNRYVYLQKIFRDVITELDPNYIDPYWIGALIMSIEAKDLDMGLGLLDKGIAANPGEWILPYMAGWECYHARRYDRAARYFDMAIAVPGSPPVIRRAYAAMFQRLGDLRAALAAWGNIASDPQTDEHAREVARRRVRDLTIELDLERVRGAVARYAEARGVAPTSLEDLLRSGLLQHIPLDPDGNPYRYDPKTGQVRAHSELVLGGR